MEDGTSPSVNGAQAGRMDAVALRAIIDNIPARVTLLDLDHRYLYANREFLAFIGRSLDEVVGRTLGDIMGEDVFQRALAFGHRVFAGETVRRDGWLPYGNGPPRFVQQILVPYRPNAEAIEGLLAFTRDLTELKEKEEALARQVAALEASEASMAAVFTASLDSIVMLDEAGRILEFNPSAEETFGYARAFALGRPAADLIVPPDSRARYDGMARYLATGWSTLLGQRTETTAMRADGTIFPIELTVSELRLPGERRFAAHVRDLTAARTAQAEIERQRTRLHQVEKLSAMGSLLAGVAHELNNPLAIILAQATLLQKKADSEPLRQRADKIHAAAARAGRIVKGFLAMARQKPLERKAVNLNELVEAAVEITAYGRRSAGILLDLDLDPTGRAIEADADMLGQVATNLIVNATQALSDQPGARRVWVETRFTEAAAIFAVADNGPGVPPDLSARIFEPYYTTKPAGAGTGIGLAISRDVVETHGGRIELEPRPGGGALFRVVLPATGARPVESREQQRSEGRGLRALVVDDEPDVAEALGEMLAELGFDVVLAEGATDALRRSVEAPFDLVFADLRMPVLSGVELYERVHQLKADSRFVLMTGDTIAGPDLVARHPAGRPGAGIGLLEKPFTPSDVAAAVARALSRDEGGPPERHRSD